MSWLGSGSSSMSSSSMQQSQMVSTEHGYKFELDSLKYLNERIKELQEEGKLPDLTKEYEYTIYRWKSGFFGHESIVLGCQGKYFTIELRVMDSILILDITVENINIDKLKECGNKKTTGHKMIVTGVKVLINMHEYNYASNNCQDFVNNFLKEIKLIDQIEDTDFQKLVCAAGTTVAIGGLALLGFSWLNANNQRR